MRRPLRSRIRRYARCSQHNLEIRVCLMSLGAPPIPIVSDVEAPGHTCAETLSQRTAPPVYPGDAAGIARRIFHEEKICSSIPHSLSSPTRRPHRRVHRCAGYLFRCAMPILSQPRQRAMRCPERDLQLPEARWYSRRRRSRDGKWRPKARASAPREFRAPPTTRRSVLAGPSSTPPGHSRRSAVLASGSNIRIALEYSFGRYHPSKQVRQT